MVVFATALGTCSVTWSARGSPAPRCRRPAGSTASDVHDADDVPARRSATRSPGWSPCSTATTATSPRSRSTRTARRLPTASTRPRQQRARTAATYARPPAPSARPPPPRRRRGAGQQPGPINGAATLALAAARCTGPSAPVGFLTKRCMLEIENVPGFAQVSRLRRSKSGPRSLAEASNVVNVCYTRH